MPRIKLTDAGFENFTGSMNDIDFVNGIAEVSAADAERIKVATRVVLIDSDDESLGDVPEAEGEVAYFPPVLRYTGRHFDVESLALEVDATGDVGVYDFYTSTSKDLVTDLEFTVDDDTIATIEVTAGIVTVTAVTAGETTLKAGSLSLPIVVAVSEG